MKLGLITDIHEHVEYLREALDVFEHEGVDQVVVIGDVFEMGHRIAETTELLAHAGAMGVWGNHDCGLSFKPTADTQAKYAAPVLEFMTSLRPRLAIDDCHFSHVEPWLNPEKLEDLWYFDGMPDTQEKLSRSFDSISDRVMFVGHFHRWQAATPSGVLDWQGDRPMALSNDRYLVVVGALCEGRFATYHTVSGVLHPFKA